MVNRGRLLALAYAAVAVAVLALRPAPTPGPGLRDFEAYWSAGATFDARADPYGRAIWSAERGVPGVNPKRDELLPFIAPPPTLLAWTVLAKLPYPIASDLWSAILALALLTLVAATLRGSDAPLRAFEFCAALALAVGFGPVTSALALGQLALPAFASATFAVVLAMQMLPAAAAAACIAFAQPNVALGLASQLGRTRATPAIALGALAAYLLGVPVAGWAWPAAYARAAAAHGASERFVAIQFAPGAIAHAFGAAPGEARFVGIAAALLAVAAAVGLAVRVRDRFARFAAWSALIPFTSIFFHEHNFVVAYPAAIWSALQTRATTRAIALAGTLLVAIDWLGLAQRPTGIWQSALLAIAAGSAFTALGRAGDGRGVWRVVVPVVALFLCASWLAAHHPLSVWPDALGDFHAPANATAAAVWLAEQRASGLLAAVPAWGALRALSLLGCALLAVAIYRHRSFDRTA